MKKRNILLMFGLCAMLAFTACGSTDGDKEGNKQEEDADKEAEKEEVKEKGLEGVWTASIDISDLMSVSEEEPDEDDAEMAEALKGVTLDMQFTFDAKNVKVEVTKDAAKKLEEQMKNAFIKYFDNYMAEYAEQMGISVDDMYALAGGSREQFINSMLEQMNLNDMASQMTEELVSTGTYVKEDKVLKVTYTNEDSDGSTEEWKYELDGDTLKLSVKDESGKEQEFTCKRK